MTRRRYWLSALLLTWLGTAASVAAPSPRSVTHELDRSEALLRERVSGLPPASGIVVLREPTRLTLRLPVGLLFAPDSAQLLPAAAANLPLSAAVHLLQKEKRLQAGISVYTDAIGGGAVNQSFSARRAEAVRNALGRAGVVAARLSASGQGAGSPLDNNDTTAGRIANRRVEIVFERPEAGAGSAPAGLTR